MKRLTKIEAVLPGTVLEFAIGLTDSPSTRVFVADIRGNRICAINLKTGSRKILELEKISGSWSIGNSHPVQILNNKETVDAIAEALTRKVSGSKRAAMT